MLVAYHFLLCRQNRLIGEETNAVVVAFDKHDCDDVVDELVVPENFAI